MQHRVRLVLWGFVAVLWLHAPGLAQTELPTVPWDVREATLDNGLKVLLLRDARAPVVTFMVWYRVGARNEQIGSTGLAYLLEHLMFKGTKNYDPKTFSHLIQGDYYRPEGAIVVVVGDVAQDEAKKVLLDAFAGWTGAPQAFPHHPDIDLPDELDVITLDRDVSQAHILFGHSGIRRDHPDYYAIQVMNYILGGGGFESRLLTSIREEQGLAYNAWSAFPSGLVGGTFMTGLSTKNATANQALDLLFATMRHLPTATCQRAGVNQCQGVSYRKFSAQPDF